tara:strand:+ start:312 stop:494 length:183 start_codon:yes stop_codon:yes gene_type:complete
MNTGDLVKYRAGGDRKELLGVVKEMISRRWALVEWEDNVVYAEHIDDLCEARGSKKRKSK